MVGVSQDRSNTTQLNIHVDPYSEFISGLMRFAHLRTDAIKQFDGGICAHPLHTINDQPFVDAITSKIKLSLINRSPTLEQIDEARQQAVTAYVQENILGKNPDELTSISDKAIALIHRCFPNEQEAPFGWGRAYFEALQKMPLRFIKDEVAGKLEYGFEGLCSYLYLHNGEPIASGGLYTEVIPEIGHVIWGSRIAIAPEHRSTTLFGKMLAHLGASAISLLEANRIQEAAGAPKLAPSLAVFTTRADWNQDVINIYKALGMKDMNRDFVYNGLTEMVMFLPDLMDSKVKNRLDKFVARFGGV